MAFKRTPEMTRQVKNIVDAINHRRERDIKAGIELVGAKVKKSEVWRTIMNSPDPQKTYDEFIGTKINPGKLRATTPSYHTEQVGVNSKGLSFSKTQERVDKVFNEMENIQRKAAHDMQVQAKIDDFLARKPDDMPEEQAKQMLDDIVDQAGPLAESKLPEYGTYDSAKYRSQVSLSHDLEYYVNSYLDAFEKYGLKGAFSKISNILEKFKRNYPKKLLEIFQSGDKEAEVDYMYDIFRHGIRNEIKYVVGMGKIISYWEQKYIEAENEYE